MTQKIEGAVVNTNDETGAVTVHLPAGASGAKLKSIVAKSKEGKKGGKSAVKKAGTVVAEIAEDTTDDLTLNNPSPSDAEATEMASTKTAKKGAAKKGSAAAKKNTPAKGSAAVKKGAAKKGAAAKAEVKPKKTAAPKAPKAEGAVNTNRKLDYMTAQAIRHKLADGQKRGQIAKEFNVDPFTIQAVAIGYTYPVQAGDKNPLKPAQIAEYLKSNLPRAWKVNGIPEAVLKAAHLNEAPKA